VIVGVGIDTLELQRLERLWQRAGEHFLQRVYTAAERAYCLQQARPVPSLAARFCAKEAVMKCLGTGWTGGVGFRAIEVVRAASGAVAIALHGTAAAVARAQGIRRVHLSLSHNEHSAVAVAVAEG
jgi:holo-[acyl-carrier protein] synthase